MCVGPWQLTYRSRCRYKHKYRETYRDIDIDADIDIDIDLYYAYVYIQFQQSIGPPRHALALLLGVRFEISRPQLAGANAESSKFR